MENITFNALAGSSRLSSNEENFPREGLVNDVCKGWLLHEDQALAYRLQSEEYQSHFGHNKERNARLRQDFPKAREEQIKEDEEAARTQNENEITLAEQETSDAVIAARLASELEMKEMEQHKRQELKDYEYAKKLMDQEKSKFRQKKELRQVEREAAYLGINSGLDNVAILSRKGKRNPRSRHRQSLESRRSPSLENLSDLSDFCLQPNSSMDEDEQRRLQEEQDEELARLIQEQDLKRRGDLLREDQLAAIEAQDKELAKVLQEQEKAKAKKGREKSRQKVILKKQQKQLLKSKDEREKANTSFESTRLSESSDGSHYACIGPPIRRSPSPYGQVSRSPGSNTAAARLVTPSQSSPSSTATPSSPYSISSSSHLFPDPKSSVASSQSGRAASPQYATPILRPRNVDASFSSDCAFDETNALDVKGNVRHSGDSSSKMDTREQAVRNKEVTSRFAEPDFDRIEVESFNQTPPKHTPGPNERQETPKKSSLKNYSPSSTTPPRGGGPTPPRGAGFPNIACAIDPTYERRVRSGEFSPSASVVSSGTPYQKKASKHSPSSHTSGKGPSVSGCRPPAACEDEDDYLPPPYMPLQGQRRTSSLEKGKGGMKLPKEREKGSKESGCRQQ